MVTVRVGCAALLAVVFALSCSSKLRNAAARREFIRSVRNWQLVPARLVRPIGVALIGAEGAAAVLLAAAVVLAASGAGDGLQVVAFGGAAGLLFVLTGGLLAIVRSGRAVSCACFGATASPVGRVHVVRNLALLATAGVGLATAASGAGSSLPPAVALLCSGAGLVGALVLTRLDDLVGLFAMTTAAPTSDPILRRS